MLIDDSFQNTRIICLNGAELNGDCISDSFFSVQFFMTLGIMVFFFVLLPILLIVFIVFCVKMCRKDKKSIKKNNDEGNIELTQRESLSFKLTDFKSKADKNTV